MKGYETRVFHDVLKIRQVSHALLCRQEAFCDTDNVNCNKEHIEYQLTITMDEDPVLRDHNGEHSYLRYPRVFERDLENI